jgi:hypothetical protein
MAWFSPASREHIPFARPNVTHLVQIRKSTLRAMLVVAPYPR